MADLSNQGLVPLDRFLALVGMDKLQFKKGKGRQFCSTPVGVVFMSAQFDGTKEKYITVASDTVKTLAGDSLEGSLWLTNANIEDGDIVTA